MLVGINTIEQTPADAAAARVDRLRWLAPAGIAALLLTMMSLWLRALPWDSRVATTSARLGALASLTGLAGTVLLSVAIVLSARVRILESVAGGLDREYRLHHHVGAWAFTLIALHPSLLAWRSAQVSWRRAGTLWWPAGSDMPLIAGQLALYGMAVAMAVTMYARVRYQALRWMQRLLGAMFVPAAYHVLATDSEVNTDAALRYFLWVVLSAGAGAGVPHGAWPDRLAPLPVPRGRGHAATGRGDRASAATRPAGHAVCAGPVRLLALCPRADRHGGTPVLDGLGDLDTRPQIRDQGSR